ncbi:MAG: hypothetical protein QM758_10725 [Armatimonas sp.]
MTTLRGIGQGRGTASGMAAHLRAERGRPQLDPALLEQVWKRRMAGLEPLDVVLITEDAALALLTPLPTGANLVGVIAELPLSAAALPNGVCVVSGVGPAQGRVEDGTLVVIEPEVGRALLDPSAKELARLQKATKPRLRLDGDSVPARTLGGREILVWGEALSLDDAEEAMAAGADGLLFTGLLDFPTAKQLTTLVGGGDLTLQSGPDALDTEDWLRLATIAALRVCLPDDADPEFIRSDWDEALERLTESGERVALPRLSTRLMDSPDTTEGWDELLLDALWVPDDLLTCPPLYLCLNGDFTDLEAAIAAGIIGVCVAPAEVATAKEAIRELE